MPALIILCRFFTRHRSTDDSCSARLQSRAGVGRFITGLSALLWEPSEASEKQTFSFYTLQSNKTIHKLRKAEICKYFHENHIEVSDLVVDINQNTSNIFYRTFINVKKNVKFHKDQSDLKTPSSYAF